MGLSKLENTIKDNIEYFEKEPSMDHMDKFLFKLKENEEEKKSSFIKLSDGSWWIGIAASISLLVTIAWFIGTQSFQFKNNQQMGLSLELNEIKNYYTQESDKKMKEINECTNNSNIKQKMISDTESQILKLNFNAENIENKLIEAKGNKKLELAYIQSLKAKNDLVNKMHDEICVNNNSLTQ